jgi:excisionase family DNA binding protein
MSNDAEIAETMTPEVEPHPELLSRSEAARFLGVHDDTIYRWSRKGLLNPVKLPSGISRYRLADLEAIKNGQSKHLEYLPH